MAVRVAEVDFHPRVDPQPGVLTHLGSLIPGQRPPQLLQQDDDRARDGVAHRFSAVAGQCRSVLDARSSAVIRHARQVKQHREPRGTLHQRANRGTAQAQDEVPFPMSRHRTVGRFRRTLADQDLGGDMGFASPTAARPRHAQRPTRAQAGRQLAASVWASLRPDAARHGLVCRASDRWLRG